MDLVVTTMLTVDNNDSPPHLAQPSQSPNHVHLFFHSFLLVAHHCLHTVTIAKVCVVSLDSVQNHNRLHLPAAFNLVLGEAVVTAFAVETRCRDGRVEVET